MRGLSLGGVLALAGLLAVVSASSCGEDDRPASWAYIHAAIIFPNCATVSCHSQGAAQGGGVRLYDRDVAYKSLVGYGCGEEPPDTLPRNYVDPGSPERSKLMYLLYGDDVRYRMPPDRPLPDADVDLIERWILEGASCN
jgi:predicted CxxxxCH...CXXCH cytochrome family protein